MFKSLQMKLVLIFFVLITSVMSILGTFLLNSVTKLHFEDFNAQISSVFTTDVISNVDESSKNDSPLEIKSILDAYTGAIGIDNNRDYYIIDRNTAKTVLTSSNDVSKELTITPNISNALNGQVGFENSVSSDYIDVAIPLENHVIYIIDDKSELDDMTWMLFSITLQAMFLGFIVSIVLSLALSKTMTNPIEDLTRGAIKRANGDFGDPIKIQSNDEIGVLTDTFNQMSTMLERTIEKVEEEKKKLSTVFLHMTDGVLAFTKDGNIINMNLKAEKMLGIKFSDSFTFKSLFPNLSLPKTIANPDIDYIESEIEHLNKVYKVLFAPFGNFEEVDSGIIVVIYDVTESKRLEDARREFVANVSHELRTPLTNIKSYTETIMENRDMLDPETETKFLDIISGETDRMTRIVRDLLTLSKLDHNKIDINFDTLDLNKILQNVYNAMILVANNSCITITTDLDEHLGRVYGDRDRLEQVITNLVSNSVKYNHVGGEVCITAKNLDSNNVLIEVSDNGFGIPEDDLPRIFERFYRVDKARSREKGGTGLGLAIAKNIVEIHNGQISIDSKLEKGTTVSMILPIIKDNENEKV